MNNNLSSHAVVCVANQGNEVSLQLWKIYKTIRDEDAQSEGFVRVVDESGEDYLFPEENFVPIELPRGVKTPFERAVREQRRAATPHQSLAAKRVASNRGTGTSKRRANRAPNSR